jgi:hypothetical protein
MQKNMGNADRIIRVLFALLVATLWLTVVISGTTGILLGIFALVFVVTSIAGRCPLYGVCRISTLKTSSKPNEREKT